MDLTILLKIIWIILWFYESKLKIYLDKQIRSWYRLTGLMELYLMELY